MSTAELPQNGQDVRFVKQPAGSKPLPPGQVQDLRDGLVFVGFGPDFDPDAHLDLQRSELTLAWSQQGREHECPALVKQIGPGKICLELQVDERRDFLRIPTRLHLRYRILDDTQAEEAARVILSGERRGDDFEIDNPGSLLGQEELGDIVSEQYSQILRLVHQLDSKLDHVITLLEKGQGPTEKDQTVHLMDISGAGLGFLGDQPLEPETRLFMRIVISRFPEVAIDTLGRVRRCQQEESAEGETRYDIGVQFETIHHLDRERIFRFISRSERRLLRQRKNTIADHF